MQLPPIYRGATLPDESGNYKNLLVKGLINQVAIKMPK